MAHEVTDELFCPNCKKSGSIPQYADNATYTVASNSRESNQWKLNETLETVSKFLNDYHS